jgi:hypothetical protein
MDIDITDAILAEAHISICQFFERIRMLMGVENFPLKSGTAHHRLGSGLLISQHAFRLLVQWTLQLLWRSL